MAITYVAMGLTTGTGSGTKIDPWPIQDVLIFANPKGITSPGTIACLTDGATLQSTTVIHHLPGIGYWTMVPVDLNGDPEPDLKTYGFDSSGVASGTAFTMIGTRTCCVVAIKIINSPGTGIDISGNCDESYLMGAQVEDSAGTNLLISSGSEHQKVVGFIGRGGQQAFRLLDNIEGSTLHECAFLDFTKTAQLSSGRVSNCILDTALLDSVSEALITLGAGAGPILERCTLRNFSTAAINPKGVLDNGNGITQFTYITDSHVEMNNQANSVAYQGSSSSTTQMLFRGNGYWNALTGDANYTLGDPAYTAPSNFDLAVVDQPGENYTPSADTSSYAFRKALLSTPNPDVGAIIRDLGSGGGAGGYPRGRFTGAM